MRKNRIGMIVTMVFILGLFLTPQVSAQHFPDLPDWADEEIRYLNKKKIVYGLPDGRFGSNETISRGDAALMLARAKKLRMDHQVKKSFPDVTKNMYYFGAIEAAVKAGYLSGYPNGEFRPRETLTREEMAKVIAHAYHLSYQGEDLESFTDISNSWAKQDINALKYHGISNGLPNGTFLPKDNISRAEFSVMLSRAMNDDFKLNQEEQEKPDQPEVPVVTEVEQIQDKEVMIGSSSKDLNLPKKLKVTYSDGKVTQQDVIWNTSRVDFSKVGKYEVEGQLNDITEKIEVTVIVVPYTVESIYEFSERQLYVGDTLDYINLPPTIPVTYSNGEVFNHAVTWDKSEVDFTKAGKYNVIGAIDGLTQEAIVLVNVLNIKIKEIEDVEDKVMLVNEDVNDLSLPQKLRVNYTNGDLEYLDVTWDASQINFNQAGTYKVIGDIKGIKEKVSFNVTISTKKHMIK